MFKNKKIIRQVIASMAFAILFVFFSINNIRNKKPAFIEINTSGPIHNSKLIYGITYNNHLAPYDSPNYFKELVYLKKSQSSTATVTIKINNKEYHSNYVDFKDNIKIIGKDSFYSLTGHLKLPTSSLPYFNKIINFEGFAKYCTRLFSSPIILLLTIAFLFSFFSVHPFQARNQLIRFDNWPNAKLTPIVEIAAFIFLFLVLTRGNMLYFLQDDNYIQFSPVITESLNDFYSTGNWPNYNFFQHAGLPTAGFSIYSMYYIGTHFSFLLAKYLLQDVNAFSTVFAFIHFFIGYYFLLKFFKLIKIVAPLAMIASLCFVFSGFNIMASRSWYYIAPSIAFIPVLLYLRVKWSTHLSLKKTILFGILLALYAYSGNVQFWVYSIFSWLLLELGFTLTKHQRFPIRFLLLSLGSAIILFAPQIYLTSLETKGLNRIPDINLNLFLGINQMIHPFNNSTVVVDDWAGPLYSEYNWVFFKCCFLFAIICFWMLFQFLFGKKVEKLMVPLLLVFLILLLYGSGKYGLLASIGTRLPVFNLFMHPFKIMLFINFILVIVGTYYVNKIKSILWIIVISLLLFINLCWQVTQTQSAFHMYTYKEPYKKPSYLTLLDKHLDYRVLPVGPFRSFDENYAYCMQHSLATKYRIPSLESLEVLNPKDIDLNNNYADFSVRYIIQYKSQSEFIKSFGSNIYLDSLKNKDSLVLIYNDSTVSLYENKHYTPLVVCYNKDRVINSIPAIQYSTTKLTISYPEKIIADKVLLTLNYRKPLTLYLDGKKATVNADTLNRTVVQVLKPFNKIEVKYKYW